MSAWAYVLFGAFCAFVLGVLVMWHMRLSIFDSWMRDGMPPDQKPWWHSRTLWLNMFILGLAAAEAQLHVLQPMLPVDVYRLLAFGLPVLNAMLRLVTNTGLTPR